MSGHRGFLLATALLAVALRAYPLHVFYLHPDQTNVPYLALHSLVASDWRPVGLVYPSGYMYVLRAAYAIAYHVGHATGRFEDRIDFLATFFERPFPFLLIGRVFSCVLGVVTVLLTARLGQQLFGAGDGVVAGLFLAVAFLHVRESHYGSLDVPGTAFFTAALLAAETYRQRGELRTLLAAGALAGLATAFRYQLAVIVLAIPAAELLRRGGAFGTRLARLALAAAAGAAAFAVLSPYTVLEPARAWHDVRYALAWAYFWMGARSLPLLTLFGAGSGWLACALAAVGLAMALARRVPGTVAVLAVAVPYVIALHRAGRVFARYIIPLLPLLAVFAAGGVQAVRALVPARLVRGAQALVVLAAIADPAARSLALDRLLAREDTRHAAAGWLLANVPPADIIFVPRPGTYANPHLLMARDHVAWFGPTTVAELTRRGRPALPRPYRLGFYGARGEWTSNLATGGYVVGFDHPYLGAWARVPPSIETVLGERGEPVARFVGAEPGGAGVLYEPIDANFVPLRGFGPITRPGPNITVWKVRRAPP